MAKSKIFGEAMYFFSKMLPYAWSVSLIKWLVRVRYKAPVLEFPWNGMGIKKVFVILPEGPVDAFHQIKTYLGLTSLFQNAAFSIFCTRENGVLFHQVHPEATIVEYDTSQRYLFSRDFHAWGKHFHKEEFDLCVLLEHSPDISLLFLAGKTASPIRAGYRGAGDFPFLNVHVNPSAAWKYLSDHNFIISRIFGASDKTTAHWRVAKETVNEISHMIREFHIPPTSRLVGIDAGFFFAVFGETWTGMLVNKIKTVGAFSCYLYNNGAPDDATFRFLHAFEVPVFAQMTPSRSSALISRSDYVVTGKTVFFELANLLQKQVIGLFEKNEIDQYCRQSPSTHGISFDSSPGSTTVESIVRVLQTTDGRKRTGKEPL
jgi:ADP-heptose:LPS heptosyltransferase